MATQPSVPLEATLQVRDACLCLHAQRAARILARRFDEALKPAGLTNWQFSLLMALNGPQASSMREVAMLLGVDRTTLTAVLKPLIRRGLAETVGDPADRRLRRLRITAGGGERLDAALPLWIAAHGALEAELDDVDPTGLRAGLNALAGRAPSQARAA
jgi:DNA-binding MarR family transcriptional regulator